MDCCALHLQSLHGEVLSNRNLSSQVVDSIKLGVQETNGLLGLMGTQLFKDDVMLQPGPFGPQDIRLVLRSSSV